MWSLWERPGRRGYRWRCFRPTWEKSAWCRLGSPTRWRSCAGAKHVAIKGDQVGYPRTRSAGLCGKKETAPAEDCARENESACQGRTENDCVSRLPGRHRQPEEDAQNKPTRHAGLLKFIETHAVKFTPIPKAMSQQVCALLEARKEVTQAPDGKSVTHPKMRRATSACASSAGSPVFIVLASAR